MKSILVLASCITASIAVPASFNSMPWTPEMGALYSAASNVLAHRNSRQPSCDLSQVDIVQYASTIPGAPAVVSPGGAKLMMVAIGRGTQNYTCADNQATTIPKQVGALAHLYNVSCMAANYPSLMTYVPPFAVQYNNEWTNNGPMTGFNIEPVGEHYFNAAGTPTFDLEIDPAHSLGVLVANGKTPVMKIAAPSSASKGQAGSDQYGAVAWLKLSSTNGTIGNLTAVYRIDTAGGAAPANCSGQPSEIYVQYAAQYWFYS